MSIRHTGIVVSDLFKMTEFYKLLGFEEYIESNIKGELIDNLIGLDNADIEIVKLKSIKDDSIIELLKYKNIDNSNLRKEKKELWDLGLSHLAITVSDIGDICKTLKLHGAKFNSSPLLTDDNVKVCFCRDIENNWIEIVEDLDSVYKDLKE